MRTKAELINFLTPVDNYHFIVCLLKHAQQIKQWLESKASQITAEERAAYAEFINLINSFPDRTMQELADAIFAFGIEQSTQKLSEFIDRNEALNIFFTQQKIKAFLGLIKEWNGSTQSQYVVEHHAKTLFLHYRDLKNELDGISEQEIKDFANKTDQRDILLFNKKISDFSLTNKFTKLKAELEAELAKPENQKIKYTEQEKQPLSEAITASAGKLIGKAIARATENAHAFVDLDKSDLREKVSRIIENEITQKVSLSTNSLQISPVGTLKNINIPGNILEFTVEHFTYVVTDGKNYYARAINSDEIEQIDFNAAQELLWEAKQAFTRAQNNKAYVWAMTGRKPLIESQIIAKFNEDSIFTAAQVDVKYFEINLNAKQLLPTRLINIPKYLAARVYNAVGKVSQMFAQRDFVVREVRKRQNEKADTTESIEVKIKYWQDQKEILESKKTELKLQTVVEQKKEEKKALEKTSHDFKVERARIVVASVLAHAKDGQVDLADQDVSLLVRLEEAISRLKQFYSILESKNQTTNLVNSGKHADFFFRYDELLTLTPTASAGMPKEKNDEEIVRDISKKYFCLNIISQELPKILKKMEPTLFESVLSKLPFARFKGKYADKVRTLEALQAAANYLQQFVSDSYVQSVSRNPEIISNAPAQSTIDVLVILGHDSKKKIDAHEEQAKKIEQEIVDILSIDKQIIKVDQEIAALEKKKPKDQSNDQTVSNPNRYRRA